LPRGHLRRSGPREGGSARSVPRGQQLRRSVLVFDLARGVARGGAARSSRGGSRGPVGSRMSQLVGSCVTCLGRISRHPRAPRGPIERAEHVRRKRRLSKSQAVDLQYQIHRGSCCRGHITAEHSKQGPSASTNMTARPKSSPFLDRYHMPYPYQPRSGSSGGAKEGEPLRLWDIPAASRSP
jgi:hypothetical protein